MPQLRFALLALLAPLLTSCSNKPTSGEEPSDSGSQTEALSAAQAALAKWSSLVTVPIVPVSGANLPDGKVLLWSAEDRFNFATDLGRTYTVVFDPATGTSTQRLVTETGHDMFCPGTANLPDGRILVNGGLSSGKTSIYDPATGNWSGSGNMNIPRAYQGTAPLADGNVLTLGGSWAGGVGNKHGEVWSSTGGWRRTNGIPIDPFLSIDNTRNFGPDSHLWLLAAGNGRVLHAGPGYDMHWLETEGAGSVTAAGRRGDDEFSINGNAVLFDIGKVLKVGGGPGYEGIPANSNSYIIDVGTEATVRKIQSMAYQRSYQNSVVLPNGQVVVIGGSTVGFGFSDSYSVMVPEIFDPITETFTAMAPMASPRNYHSIALLLADGRVLSGGGGLCGSCSANHPDVQMLSPPYLFNADGSVATRPVITSAPAAANHGTNMAVVTSAPVSSFSLVRLSSTTHALNNDQRRIPLTFQTAGTNSYSVAVPRNTGWAIPGLYMLFAMNAQGTPSVAKTVRIGSSTLLRVLPVATMTTPAQSTVNFSLPFSSAAAGPLTFSAGNLPPGLLIEAATGLITGTPTTEGSFVVEGRVSDGSQTVSTEFRWNVSAPIGDPGGTGGTGGAGGTGGTGGGTGGTGGTTPPSTGNVRFVRLLATSEIGNNPWTTAAEINVLGASGAPLPRTAWLATADSAETTAGNFSAQNTLDGDTSSIWHTEFQLVTRPLPHSVTIDLASGQAVTGLRYLPRQDNSVNGTIAAFQIFVSEDGVNWGAPVAQGNFATMGDVRAEKTVMFGGTTSPVNQAPVVQQPAPAAATVGTATTLGLTASDADGDALTYAAAGLPAGLVLNAATGVISGIPTLDGTFTVQLTVSDGRGGTASVQFPWTVQAAGGNPTPGDPEGSRYIRLRALSEINGAAWSAAAEINVLGASGVTLPRTGWTATADSQATGYAAQLVLDGNANSLWHTAYEPTSPPPPHTLTIDMGATRTVTALKYLPRQDGSINGTIQRFEIHLSADGVTWGSPVATGDFSTMGDVRAEKTVTISTSTPTPPTNHAPSLVQPADMTGTVGSAAGLALQAVDVDGDPLTYTAVGLPPGLTLAAATGVVSGTPTIAGTFTVQATVTDGRGGSATVQFIWTVQPAGGGNPDPDPGPGDPGPSQPGGRRYLMLQVLSDYYGNPWASAAELNLLGGDGLPLPRTAWTITADSAELSDGNFGPANLIDGSTGSIWHTGYSAGNVPMPHWIKIDLGAAKALTGLKLWPRQSGGYNGTPAEYAVYVSNDGVTWGAPIAEGDFADTFQVWDEKVVSFTLPADPGPGNTAPLVQQPSPGAAAVGVALTFMLVATDADGDALSYAATGLPPGLTVNPLSGVISGTPTAAGSFDVNVTVSDGEGGVGTAQFTWSVGSLPASISPISAPIAAKGSVVSYTANASGGSGLEFSWDFGDGTTPTPFVPSSSTTHTFVNAGVYVVTVTARGADGSAVTAQFLQGISSSVLATSSKSSSSVALETRAAGLSARLWVVNIDNDSVSVFDAATLAKQQEIPVGVSPRSVAVGPDGRVWVTNKGDSTVSLIDPNSFAVTSVAMARASAPYGIVIKSDNTAYVALEGTGKVVKLRSTGVVQAIATVGSNPRHLALTAAGDRLLVSRFISPFQAGESTAVVQTSVGGVNKGAEVLVIPTGSMVPSSTITLQFSDKIDSTVAARGLPNYLGAPAIAPDGLSAWVPSKQDNLQRGTLRSGQGLDFQTTVRAISSRIDMGTLKEDYPSRVDHDNSGVASAAVFHPSGVYLFVALEASRQVAVLDPAGKRELFRIEAGFAPQALVLSSDGKTLFVNNAMERNLGVYDLRPLLERGSSAVPLVTTLASVGTEKLAPAVLRGKQLFYDARDVRLARDGYLSCASCHNDGADDGRTWDFTGFGEGLRNTISLRGRASSHGRLHWTANFDELQDFEGQIRTFAQGTGLMTDAQLATGTRANPLGDPKQGLSADLDALAAYVSSLNSFAPSPFRSAAGALTNPAINGAKVFVNNCVDCHNGAGFTDSAAFAVRNVGTSKPSSGSRLGGLLSGFDTPTLRDVWATAPYLHDGSAPTLQDAVQAHSNVTLSATDLTNVVAYLQQIGSEEPAAAAAPGLYGQYFMNATLSGASALLRNEAVNFNWGAAGPATGWPVDNFSARWTGKLSAPTTGNYRLRTVSDDGLRLWLDGVLLIDNWSSHAATTNTSGVIPLVAGSTHDVKLEYYEASASSVIRLYWALPSAPSTYVAIPAAQLQPAGGGLLASYFGNAAHAGPPLLQRYEAPDFAWGSGAPSFDVPADNFSARWTGKVAIPTTGTYKFQTVSDNSVRVWINNQLVIDNWTAHGPTSDESAGVLLVAGQRYDVKIEFAELTGDATLRLNWQPPGAPGFSAVPLGQLFGN